MDENLTNDSVKADAATNAVSIFGQAGTSDEFPVLKAFQQYIDAEQAKARKRMLGLSVFFIVLLVLVVGMFTIILTMMLQRNQEQADRLMQRNQEQADRLLELALRERQTPQAPVAPVVVNQGHQDTLKPVLEQLANLASAIKEKNQPPQQVAPQPVATPTDAQAEIQRKLDAELQKLAEARAKLKADQEQARKDEIERQRRRLYPEYYAAQDRAAAAAAAAERALAVPAPTPAAPTLPAQPAATLPAQPVVQQPPVQPVIETPPVALPAAPSVPQQPAVTPAAPAPLPAPEPSKQPVATGSDAAPSGTVDYVLPVGTKKTKGVKWRVPIPE